jgi:hypothetical protein
MSRLNTSSKPCAWVQPRPCQDACDGALWKPVPSLPGYEASDEGRVRHGTKVLRGSHDDDGYVIHATKYGRRKAHRIVCEAFHGPCPVGGQCGHLDGTKSNNRPGNLAWVTARENSDHKRLHNTVAEGERSGMAKLTDEQVREIWLSPLSSAQESRRQGIGKHAVWSIRHGNGWRHVTKDLPPQPKRAPQKVKIPIPDDFTKIWPGMTCAALVRRYGVCRTTIWRWQVAIRKGDAR